MPGGLIQLASYGSENHYLNGNPQITFFKSVYKRHTNFAMESIDMVLEGPSQLSPDKTSTYRIKIPRNGDLINKMFLRVDLPDIYSTSEEEFYWTRAIGLAMINYIDIYIGGSKIERLTGQFLDINSQLTHNSSKRHHFKKSVGDTIELTNYGSKKLYHGYSNTQFVSTDSYYTHHYHKFFNTRPSIFGKQLVIPLDFWFSRTDGNALPLIALQYHDVEIEMELKAVKDLYTILKPDPSITSNNNKLPKSENLISSGNILINAIVDNAIATKLLDETSNTHYLETYRTKSDGEIFKYVNPPNIQQGKTWELNPQLDINYIYLDTKERQIFAQNTHEYLINQVQYFTKEKVYGETIMEIEPFHPVKEFYMVAQTSDSNTINEWLDYSNTGKRPFSIDHSHDFHSRQDTTMIDDIYLYQDAWYHNAPKFVSTEFFNEYGNSVLGSPGIVVYLQLDTGIMALNKNQYIEGSSSGAVGKVISDIADNTTKITLILQQQLESSTNQSVNFIHNEILKTVTISNNLTVDENTNIASSGSGVVRISTNGPITFSIDHGIIESNLNSEHHTNINYESGAIHKYKGRYGYEFTGTNCHSGNKYQTSSIYKLEDYINFRLIWPYYQLNNIPKITKDNFHLWKYYSINNMEIRFNGQIRQEKRDFTYYNSIQSHMYHSNNIEQPILTYSFALKPEDYQPTGACNFSKVENMTLHVELINPPFIQSGNKYIPEWTYDLKLYMINFNILKIMGGMGSLVYAN